MRVCLYVFYACMYVQVWYVWYVCLEYVRVFKAHSFAVGNVDCFDQSVDYIGSYIHTYMCVYVCVCVFIHSLLRWGTLTVQTRALITLANIYIHTYTYECVYVCVRCVCIDVFTPFRSGRT
jgi:hypothetical protein